MLAYVPRLTDIERFGFKRISQACNQFILQSARLIKSGVEHQGSVQLTRRLARKAGWALLNLWPRIASARCGPLWRRSRSNTLLYRNQIKRRSHAC